MEQEKIFLNDKVYAGLMGFPSGSDSKEFTCSVKSWVQSLSWEDPLEEGRVTLFNILAWRIPMDREGWWATAHEVTKSWTRETKHSTAGGVVNIQNM